MDRRQVSEPLNIEDMDYNNNTPRHLSIGDIVGLDNPGFRKCKRAVE